MTPSSMRPSIDEQELIRTEERVAVPLQGIDVRGRLEQAQPDGRLRRAWKSPEQDRVRPANRLLGTAGRVAVESFGQGGGLRGHERVVQEKERLRGRSGD